MRLLIAGLATLGAAALFIPTIASAAPNPPRADPTVTSVQKQLGALALKNTQLVEKYNQAGVAVKARQKAADTASRKAASLQADFDRARLQLSQTVAAQYEGGAFSATGALLSSSNGQSYLDQLNTMSVMSAHTAQVLGRLSSSQQAAASAQKHAASLLNSAKDKRKDLAKEKASVQRQVDKYTTLLATLTSAQREAFQRAMNPSVTPPSPSQAIAQIPPGVSGKAKIAVKFALAQVGKPYVFGAAGPDSYDCSGLTMAAWGAAGVSLPHSAADQSNYGTHVSTSQLQAGDLVFMYPGISHVTIYIGDGMMVSAPQEGENVSVVPYSSYASDVVGATRLP
jgi:peptidoglycan DL-endopeptidase CwlO